MEIIFLAFSFFTLGAFAGLMAGLLGIGGGLILVPVLVMLFDHSQLFPNETMMHMALGTSMATIIFTSFASARAHYRLNNLLPTVVRNMSAGVLLGTWLGAFLATLIPAQPLAIFYTSFVVFTALNMIANLNHEPRGNLPSAFIQGLVGAFIGALSAIVSIGGGSLIVPFLNYCGVPLKRAIGSSSAIGVFVALGGSLGYILNGWGNSASYSLGYLYLPALLPLVVGSHLTAPIGARLTQKLKVKRIKQIFALLLVILALKMLSTFF